MKKSLRSQDKSIYLAFALSPFITFESILDRENSQDRQFHFQLCKGNSTTEKTQPFGLKSMLKQSEMYLYLCLPQYAQKLTETYFIKLIDETEEQPITLFQQKINLEHYIDEHNTKERDFWTEIYKATNQTQKIIIKQRVFLKRTKFELDDIINSSQKGQQYDVVDIPEHFSTSQKGSKFGLNVRKSKSHNLSALNSIISPLRLDTISEEDSNVLFTDRKQRESFGQKKGVLSRMTMSYEKVDDFEYQLKKQSTWIEKNNNFDDEFITAFQQGNHQENCKQTIKGQNFLNPDFARLNMKSTTQSEISQKGSKISKNTKDSEKQLQDNSISFLDKSSLLIDMEQSELSISADQQIYFKLKWIILVIVILVLAVVASLSTDAFDITDDEKHKAKVLKRKVQKGKSKSSKSNKSRQRKQVHA